MKFLKNRAAAIFITVVIVVASVTFGVNRTAMRMTRDIERMFYEGIINDQGFREPSINAQLETISTMALNLATLLQNYPELADDAENLLNARRTLLSADSIGEKSAAWLPLREAFAYLTLKAQEDYADILTQRDLEAVDHFWQMYFGAFDLAARLAWNYNEEVNEFRRGQNFIASLLNINNTTPEHFN